MFASAVVITLCTQVSTASHAFLLQHPSFQYDTMSPLAKGLQNQPLLFLILDKAAVSSNALISGLQIISSYFWWFFKMRLSPMKGSFFLQKKKVT
jgi:hypothetical protein